MLRERLTINYQGQEVRRVPVPGRPDVEIMHQRKPKPITMQDTYMMNTRREGISVFNARDANKGDYMAVRTLEHAK